MSRKSLESSIKNGWRPVELVKNLKIQHEKRIFHLICLSVVPVLAATYTMEM